MHGINDAQLLASASKRLQVFALESRAGRALADGERDRVAVGIGDRGCVALPLPRPHPGITRCQGEPGANS